jgi:hypothetical protein
VKLDRFETPPALAARALALATVERPAVIADFAAGGGALLGAAECRWPNAALVANDIDRGLAAALRRAHPHWSVAACNFISSSHLRARSPLARFQGAVDLALLNPPFSDRGGHARYAQCVGGSEVRSTRAISFLLSALSWLSPRGEVVGIMPSGSLTSQRDLPALDLLGELGELEVEPLAEDDLFAGCRVRVSLVRFRLCDPDSILPSERERSLEPGQRLLRFFRGQVNASSARAGALTLIHTTSLQGGRIAALRSTSAGVTHNGPMLLLPRVGKPRPDKLAIWNGGEAVISDCILAIAGVPEDELQAIRECLLASFDQLAASYVGSCAPYLTLARLRDCVDRLAPDPVQVPRRYATTRVQ